MAYLKDVKCAQIRGDEPPLVEIEIERLKSEIPEWEAVVLEGIWRLRRAFKFKNFAQALDFTQKVGVLAEAEDHHPTIITEWGKTTVSWWTHKIKGLHHNDFIMAAKTDDLYRFE